MGFSGHQRSSRLIKRPFIKRLKESDRSEHLKFPTGLHGQRNMHIETYVHIQHQNTTHMQIHTYIHTQNVCTSVQKMINSDSNTIYYWSHLPISQLKREKESIIYLVFTVPFGSLQFAS